MSWRNEFVNQDTSGSTATATPEPSQDWRSQYVEGGDQHVAQRAAQQARTRLQEHKQLFSSPDALFDRLPKDRRMGMENHIRQSFDPEGAKVRMANIEYLADIYGDPAEEVAQNLGQYRQHYLQTRLEHPQDDEMDDRGFFNLVGQELQKEEERMEFVEGILRDAWDSAVKEGGDATEAWRRTQEKYREHPGYDKRALDKYQDAFFDAYKETLQRFEPHRGAIDSLFEHIGQREDFLETEEGQEDLATVLDHLEGLSPEERDDVYFALRSKAQEQDIDIGGFFKQTGEALGRGIDDIFKGHVRNFNSGLLRSAKRRAIEGSTMYVPADTPASAMGDRDSYGVWLLGSWVPTDRDPRIRIPGTGTEMRPVTAQERNLIRDQAERFERRQDIANEIRDLAEREINPIEGSNFITDKIWYPFVETFPFSAQFFAGVSGIPLVTSSIVDMRYQQLSQRNPEMDREQAYRLAEIGAPFELVSNFIQYRLMVGRGGSFGRPFQPPAAGGMSLPKRAVADAGIRAAELNLQEGFQDMTPLVVQELASWLNEEIPGVDWAKEMEQYREQRFDVFWAMLPMVLMGTGAATFKDAQEQKAYLNDRTRLEMIGIGREQAQAIMAETDIDKKNQLYQDAFAERDAAISEEGIQRAESQMAEFAWRQESQQSPTVVAKGDNTFDVEGPDGAVLGSTNSFQKAEQLVQNRMDEGVIHQEQAVADMVAYFDEMREDGVIIERQDVEQTLQDDIDAGRLTEDEAYERIRIAGMNTGEDFGALDPSEVMVFGRNQREFRDNVYQDVITIHKGADPLDVVEEHAEVHLKRSIEEQRIDWPEVQAWKDQFEEQTGLITHENSEIALTEWFSERAKDYIVGRNKEVPGKFRGFLNQMREYMNHVLRRAAVMMKLERDGKLDGTFQAELRRAVGLDRQWTEARQRNRMREIESEQFDQATRADADMEISRAVRGRLPHPEVARERGDILAGELEMLADHLIRHVTVKPKGRKQYTRRDMSKVRAFFAPKTAPYQSTDQIREVMVTEYGFDFATPADMLNAVDLSLRGMEQFPTFSGEAAYSMRGRIPRRDNEKLQKYADLVGEEQISSDHAAEEVWTLNRSIGQRAKGDSVNRQELETLVAQQEGNIESLVSEDARQTANTLEMAIGEEQLSLEQPSVPMERKKQILFEFAQDLEGIGNTELGLTTMRTEVQPERIRVIGRKLKEGIKKDLQVNFIGSQVTHVEHLVALAQALRNPKFETFYMIGIRDRTVAGAYALTSRVPFAAAVTARGETMEQSLDNITNSLVGMGADKYYILHNHPSGHVTPSDADKNVTGRFWQGIYNRQPALKFQGHVIINHGAYTVLDYDGSTRHTGSIEMSGPDNILVDGAAVPVHGLGEGIYQASSIVAIGQNIQAMRDNNSPDAVTMIAVDRNNIVVGAAEVNYQDLASHNDAFWDEMRSTALDMGAAGWFAMVQSRNPNEFIKRRFAMKNLVLDGKIYDAAFDADPLTQEAVPDLGRSSWAQSASIYDGLDTLIRRNIRQKDLFVGQRTEGTRVQEEVIGVSYALRPKGKKYPAMPTTGQIQARATPDQVSADDRNYMIKSMLSGSQLLFRAFKSGTEILRQAEGHTPLAEAIERSFDLRQQRIGYVQKTFDQFIKKNLSSLPKEQRRQAYASFNEYMAARENSKVRPAEEIVDQELIARDKTPEQVNFILEQRKAKEEKRAEARAAEAMNVWRRMPKVAKDMVALVDRFGRETAEVNRGLLQPGGIRGIRVKDGKSGQWRLIGQVKQFWPRAFRREVQQAVRDRTNHMGLWNQLVDALMAEGYIQSRDEADAYLAKNATALTEDSHFAGVEEARRVQLPEIFYDYSFDQMINYGTKWANRTAQIESFGQEQFLRDRGAEGDLFQQHKQLTADQRTREYIEQLRERVYNVRPNDIWHKIMANANILATGLMLGNPATGLVLNLFGGTGLNFQAYGVANSSKALVDTVRNWSEMRKEAVERGILMNDLYSLMADYENASTYVAGRDLTEGLRSFAQFTLKYGGYLPAEKFIRTHAMVTGKHFLRSAKAEWTKNPTGYKARQYDQFFSRNRFNKELLIRDDFQEVDRWLRYASNLTQGSYKVDQTPIWIDTPIGRLLFKYQKFQTQVTRLTWNEAVKPFTEAVLNGNGRDRATAFLPVLNYFGAAFVAGTAVGALRQAIFGYIRPGPDFDEIAKALEDDERALALNLIVNRAMHSYLAAGTFGLVGNYGQMAYSVFDQERVKNPMEPPALASVKAIAELGLRLNEQGKLTARDFDDVAQQLISLYRTGKRGGLNALRAAGIEQNEAQVQAARYDVFWTRQRVRRFEAETDIGRRMTMTGRFGKNEMSPTNQSIYEAILIGDPLKAREIMRDHLNGLEDSEERNSALRSMRSSIRAREPIRIGAQTSQDDRRAFFQWAQETLPENTVERIRRVDEGYRRTARQAGLM